MPLTTSGSTASSTAPSTWSTFADANRSTAGAGLGFVLNGDGIVCLDLDHCLVGDQLAPWAADLLATIPATYVEVSPSGDGLHVWGRADVVQGRKLVLNGGNVEVYGTGRYITITGERFCGSPSTLADISAVTAALLT